MCLDNNLVQQGKKLCYECNCGFALKDTIEDRQQQLDCAIEIRLDSRVKECVQINNLVQWAQKLCYECDCGLALEDIIATINHRQQLC